MSYPKRDPRISTGTYHLASSTTRNWCATIDGEYLRAGGRIGRVRVFESDGAAYEAAVLALALREAGSR